MTMVDATDALIEISKRMARIEERDCDFYHNERWREMKIQQDKLFLDLAREKLLYLESKNKTYMTEKDEKLIKFYKEFIRRGELENDNTL